MAMIGAAPPSASVECGTRKAPHFIQPSPPTPIGSILTKDVRL
jgi:hypothetical protein